MVAEKEAGWADVGCIIIFSFIYCLFLAALGLHCGTGLSLAAVSGGCSLVRLLGFLVAVASLVEHEL